MVEKNSLSIFDVFGTSPEEGENGRWFCDVKGNGTDIDFKLRRFSSKIANKVREEIMQPYAHVIAQGETLSEEVQENLLVQQLARGIIIDWRGVNDVGGTPLACTADNITLLMSHPHLRDLRMLIVNIALDADKFHDANVAAIRGN